MANPTNHDWDRLKKVCRYLKGRPRMIQKKVDMDMDVVEVFADSDWAGCKTTRRSTSGGAAFVYGMCVKTWSTMQSGIARSSGEAELYAVNKGMAEGLGLQSLARDLVEVWTDSSACQGTCQRTGLGRMKHLEVENLWSQSVVRAGRVKLGKINGKYNVADLMTKYLGRADIDFLLRLMGVVEPISV